jgi:N-acetylglucosamine-6-phosphate deacetylase
MTVGDLLIHAGELLTAEGRQRGDLVITDGRISSWQPRPTPGGAPGGTPPPGRVPEATGVRTLDATGLVVAPGLIDLQCNGAGGIDLTAEPERLWEVAAILPRWGVTAWLPTIVTSPEEVRQRALAALAASPPTPFGAAPLGLHFEGPFLAPERRGAHAPTHLHAPDSALIDGWSRKAGVALVTLAPELPGASDVLAELVDRDVVVSLGHTSATAAEAAAAVDLGARAVTHLFSAMAPLHHREPGLVGVALTDDRLTVGVIADGVHLHPAVVDLAARALGPRLALVTDAVAALGAPAAGRLGGEDGGGSALRRVRLGDLEAVADDRAVWLADGTLAGSVLSLDQAVANAMAFAGLELDRAVRAASETPARLLGLTGERGAIVPGAVGDVVLLDVTGGGVEVVATVIGGEVAFDRRTSDVGDPG